MLFHTGLPAQDFLFKAYCINRHSPPHCWLRFPSLCPQMPRFFITTLILSALPKGFNYFLVCKFHSKMADVILHPHFNIGHLWTIITLLFSFYTSFSQSFIPYAWLLRAPYIYQFYRLVKSGYYDGNELPTLNFCFCKARLEPLRKWMWEFSVQFCWNCKQISSICWLFKLFLGISRRSDRNHIGCALMAVIDVRAHWMALCVDDSGKFLPFVRLLFSYNPEF